MNGPEKENPWLRLLAVPFLIVCGLIFISAALFDTVRDFFQDRIGELNFIYLGIGFLFFYTAVLVAEKNHMRRKFMALLIEIQNFLLGKDHMQKIEAVSILIQTLKATDGKARDTAAKELERLTGQNFGASHEKWDSWWAENRQNYLKGQMTFSKEKRKTE